MTINSLFAVARASLLPIGLVACVAFVARAADWQPASSPLMTRWARDVSPENVHPEYPRPQMARKDWQNLNGLWDYAITGRDAPRPEKFDGRILVPFPVESALSGVMKSVNESNRLWYRRTFNVAESWKNKRVLLHFGSVDWETKVWVNGREAGSHRGGYDAFSFDITAALNPSGANELVVSVWDPTDAGPQPRGKQVRKPEGIWYRPTSGIWQTVWLEPVGADRFLSVQITPNFDDSDVSCVTRVACGAGGWRTIEAEILDGDRVVSRGRWRADVHGTDPGTGWTNAWQEKLAMVVTNSKSWSPESPFLYQIRFTLTDQPPFPSDATQNVLDEIVCYFGMRKISLGQDENGHTRILLNNQPVFQLGPLDQGFWPDGLYTAPTDEALRYDIEMTKQLGFNMARKHVKVEPDRWYYWCDKLGLLVWQDMPSGDRYIGSKDPDIQRTPESAQIFETELKALITGLGNHPCIVMWVPYNEGWGQWDTPRVVDFVKQLDPSRLVNNASGWADRGVGDVNDMHMYPGPGSPVTEKNRAAVLGEFGGLGMPVKGHIWQSNKNWGYRNFTDAAGLTTSYVELLRKLFPLIKSHGLSGAVYTQTTDVEGEVNGLMTYDRALLKMDSDQVAAANRGEFPPAPLVVEILPTGRTSATAWRYTLEEPAAGWQHPDFDASGWKQGEGGFGTEGTPGATVRTKWNTSDIWLRREFNLPSRAMAGLRLLVHHDEHAEIYLNGMLATRLEGYTTDYEDAAISDESRATLKEKGNIMAVHCHQTVGGQYIDVGMVELVPASK